MPKNRWTLAFAGLWLCALTCAGSIPANAATSSDSSFIVDSWNAENGLPDNEVISVIQTQDGYLWLGTLNGLVRFDGIHFDVFDENKTSGLISDRIVYLFQDSHTNLWIGMDTGSVALLKDGKIKTFKIGKNGHEGRLVSACEDSTGAVWLYTADAHLGHYQNGKMQTWSFPFRTPAICRMIVAEKSGPLWIGEDWGMFSFQPGGFRPPAFPIDQLIHAQKLDYLLASRSGGTWRLINGHVQKWSATELEKDFGAYPWTNAIVTSACEDKKGNLIVGTLGAGVFWYDARGNYHHISTKQGLSSAYVLSLCMDRQGNLWVGTDGGGLDRIKRTAFIIPAKPHHLPAQSISKDKTGGLWIAYNAFGASYWISNSVEDFGLGQNKGAWTVLVDRRQQVWAGTWDEGLFQFQTNHFQPAPDATALGQRIFALFEDHDGHLWAGTQNGLANWNGHDWKIYTTHDGLSGNSVRAIAEDSNGDLWVGTENSGLDLLHDGKFTVYQATTNGLPGNDISCLYVDRDNVLWVGTFGHGLARFQNDKWKRYSTRDGLASNSIGYIIEDSDGDLWIGSNAGLMRIKKSALDDYVSTPTNSLPCRVYGKADGLPTRECSSGSEPAAIRTSDGRLWFPTTKGLVSVNPAELETNSQPPQVMIESVLVDGREQKTNVLNPVWSQSVTIPPGRERLEIDYTALNYSAPDAVLFKYRLEGRDTSWTDAKKERVANYSNLSPGHYRFHVIACNEDGVWNKTGSVLAITVEPQFWQTDWFRFVVIVFILAIIVSIVRYISTQKLQRQLQTLKQQEALERERSRIARDLHDQLGANLTQVALLSEMAEADKDSPEEVESHARQISQTARETTRSLDEIVWAVNPSNDTLEGLVNYACKYAQEYLALAGLRYRVDVPTQLPVTAIPPEVRHNVFLAFKESVNNVVKHAQATEAWIRLCLQPDYFTLEIEDNGRGLGNQPAPQNRNGLRNMKKRMADIHGEFTISDRENGGTIVRLHVPLKWRLELE